jgi:hypothetical protein
MVFNSYMYMFFLIIFILGISFYNQYSSEHISSKEGYSHYKIIGSRNYSSF